MRMSAHQKRVIAALQELELAHGRRWWSRHAIGVVVGAGGYHGVIQLSTMRALKAGGYIQTERSSWPKEVLELVQCGCACGEWGLTNKGRTTARSLKVCWGDEAKSNISHAKFCGSVIPGREPRDEDDERTDIERRCEEMEDGEEWKSA